MQLYSTGNRKVKTDFRTAVKRGLAPDGGLYMPALLPRMPESFWQEMIGDPLNIKARKLFDVMLLDVFSENERNEIVERAFTFEAPIVSLGDKMHVIELFHGPTLAFKDFGARTMAAMLSVFARQEKEKVTIITATSGDTGAAVAQGFHGAAGVEVYIFYPSGQVSPLQEKQFTTMGDNIRALEVDGTFDDCQRLVKSCFADPQIRLNKQLTTANSINIARLLPQMVYYIHAAIELNAKSEGHFTPSGEVEKLVCSVPSGNFGNLTAGLLAFKMGLKISRFIASTNSNHVVPDYLDGGKFQPKPSLRTISNAMDVGNPSNFDRMLDLYDHDHDAMARDITGAWYDDDLTRQTIVQVWDHHRYAMDPHTAVGYLGCKEHMSDDEQGLILATAHPAKFPETMNELLPGIVETPKRLTEIASRKKESVPVPAELDAVRDVLLKN